MSWICTSRFNHGVQPNGDFVAECVRCGATAVVQFGGIYEFETTHRKVCPLKTHREELLSGQAAAQTSKM